jgi:hypothetical protein
MIRSPSTPDDTCLEAALHLSRDDILKAQDCRTQEVDVPEWGGTVLVRGMTGRERDQFETSMLERGRGGRMVPNTANTRAKVVARCVVGEDGTRLFTDADIAALGEKSGAAIDRVFEVAARLSGLSDEDREGMARDFTPAGGNGSSSTSRVNSK